MSTAGRLAGWPSTTGCLYNTRTSGDRHQQCSMNVSNYL